MPAARDAALEYDRIFDAIIHQNDSELAALLHGGASPDVTDGSSTTPLLIQAIRVGTLEAALLLIRYGASLTTPDHSGSSPLAVAARSMIEEDSAMLCDAVLAAGANVNARDPGGRTPLYEAALLGRLSVCRLLIEHGAEVDAETKHGVTPLRAVAGKSGQDSIELMRLLTQAGASTSALPASKECRSDQLLSAFQLAVASGRISNIMFFVEECGEDPGQKTKSGITMPELAGSATAQEALRAAIVRHSVIASIDGDEDPQAPPSRANNLSPL